MTLVSNYLFIMLELKSIIYLIDLIYTIRAKKHIAIRRSLIASAFLQNYNSLLFACQPTQTKNLYVLCNLFQNRNVYLFISNVALNPGSCNTLTLEEVSGSIHKIITYIKIGKYFLSPSFSYTYYFFSFPDT